MDYLKAVILAVVEGITEFLPISSTGHLILVEAPLRLSDPGFARAFMVIIQFPAILSVVCYFWGELWPGRRATPENTAHTLRIGPLALAYEPRIISVWFKVVAGFMPAAVLGLLLNDLIEGHLLYPLPVAIALLTGGVLLIVIERRGHNPRFLNVHAFTYTTAVLIGCFQCLAMVPGTSRSAATIIGGMLLGASRPAAAEFSFFLAIPTMLGACTVSLAKHGLSFTTQQWALLAVGSVMSFIVAYVSIAFLMHYIRRHDFQLFGWYRIVLAAVVIALLTAGLM
ncbi:MAG: undecaprenyl-diphosphate phosphatase [Candidatus Hydrogenedentota bacterium]